MREPPFFMREFILFQIHRHPLRVFPDRLPSIKHSLYIFTIDPNGPFDKKTIDKWMSEMIF